MTLYKVDMNDLGTGYMLTLGVYERRLHMLYKHDDEEAIWLYERHHIDYLDDEKKHPVDMEELKSIEKQGAVVSFFERLTL